MKKIMILLLLVAILLVSACTTTSNNSAETENKNNVVDEEMKDIHWLDYKINDVNAKEEFKISDYKDKNIVLLETFAVWCVNCKQQQDQIKEFHKMHPEVVSISINADPNEDEEAVLEHITKNGYDWKYVVAEQSFMNLLLDEFGIVIANAPAAPIVIICEDQSYSLLPRGLKTAKELGEAVELSCL